MYSPENTSSPLIPTIQPSRSTALRHSLPKARLVISLCFLVVIYSSISFAQGHSLEANHSVIGQDPVNSNPYGIEFHPTQPLAYVALAGVTAPFGEPPETHNGTTVIEVSIADGSILRSFTVGLFPSELCIAPDASKLYVTNSTSSDLSIIDLNTSLVQQLPLTDSMGGAVGFPSGICLSPDASELWIMSNGGSFDGSSENIVRVDRTTESILGRETLVGGIGRFAVLSDGRALIPVGFPGGDFSASPELQIFDTSISPWSLVASLTLDVDTADFPAPADIAVNSDESLAYISIFGGSTEIFIVDLASNSLLPSIDVGGFDFIQQGLALTPDSNELFVTNFFQSNMSVIDLSTSLITESITLEDQPNAVRIHGGRAIVTNQASESLSILTLAGGFIRGDTNQSDSVDLADGITILGYLFNGGILACEKSADIDDSGTITLGDAVTLFTYVFSGGSAPSYPFPGRGTDLSVDSLGCI